MKLPLSKTTGLVARIGLSLIAGLLLCAMVFLFLSAMSATTDMNLNNPGQERVDFLSDSVGMNILFLGLFIAAGLGFLWVLRRLGWLRRLTASKIAWALGAWIFLWGSLWVVQSMSAPTHDSLIVTRAGVAAALDELKHLDGAYFIRFPFQLGYVLWTELWARLFGLNEASYLFMEFVNVLCLAFAEMAMVRLTARIFNRPAVTFATAVFLGLFIQPMIFCTFLYGTMPGFCFAAWSTLLLIRYIQTDKWRYAIGAAVTLTVSVILKLNNMILLVAMVIILLAHLLRAKPLRRFGAVALLCVTVLIFKNIGVWVYEARTDKDFGDGIPMVSWLAMGLSDAVTAPGWYSHQYTVGNFTASGHDPDIAAENSKAVIAERIEQYTSDPKAAADFFSDKILSQWNESSYQSIWNNQVRGQYMEKFGFAAYACGDGEATVKRYMDLNVQFIFFGMLLALGHLMSDEIRRQKSRRPDEAALYIIPLYILGGFLYHMLFEAKSQYVITYVTLMIPYAVWGVARTYDLTVAIGRRYILPRIRKPD